jgi:hypothetical protein
MCRVFGVSSSGLYAWTKRGPSARAIEGARLTARIRVFHARSKGTYGAPRIQEDLLGQISPIEFERHHSLHHGRAT